MSNLKAQIWSAFTQALSLDGNELEALLAQLKAENPEVYVKVVELLEMNNEAPELGQVGSRVPIHLLEQASPSGKHSGVEDRIPLPANSANQTVSFDNDPKQEAPFHRVMSIYQNFTANWTTSQRPNIEEHLGQVHELEQEALLRNLLRKELILRRNHGESPSLEQYQARFPQFAHVVRQVYLECSPLSIIAPHSSKATSKSPYPDLVGLRLGEYLIQDWLGQGGMGVVFEAVHVVRGDRVALKLLPEVDGKTLTQFKQEFRSAADIHHPNLVSLHTLEADGNQWFFTMDLIEGVDWVSYVRPGDRLDETRLRSSLAQLVTGVLALHGKHIIHRDLKPSNVMVTHEGQVMILDFGLVIQTKQSTHSRGIEGIAGTPGYMAPEQAAGLPLTNAADWYAVGVMLFQALCGGLPFTGSISTVIQDKQRFDPPPLPEDGGYPNDLGDLAMRLLAREPGDRPNAFDVVKATAAIDSLDSQIVTSSGDRLVGRDHQLSTLQSIYEQFCQTDAPVTAFIHGRSGEGKTTLAEHFLSPLRNDDSLVVMSGRCYDRESVPFKALDTIIDALAGYLNSLPVEELTSLLNQDGGILAQVFPVLQQTESLADQARQVPVGKMHQQQIRTRAFRGLRSLVKAISDRTPIVWFIDDLQWGDTDSANALFEILKPPHAPRMLFLGTYRSDEADGSAFLNAWNDFQKGLSEELSNHDVKVSPLTAEETVALAVGLLGQDTEVIRRRAVEFAQQTGGNPFLLIELVGCFDPQTDSFEVLPIHEVISRKLDRLPVQAEKLLQVVSVSGQAMSLEEAACVTQSDSVPSATLMKMRNERLVRLVGPEQNLLVDTYHDKVRETVLDSMPEGTRKTLHRCVAETIEAIHGGLSSQEVMAVCRGEELRNPAFTRVYDLSYHFDAAGITDKALAYSMTAARQSRQQFALEVAIEQYRVAERHCSATTKQVRFQIHRGIGESLMLFGLYDEAKARLEKALDHATDPLEIGGVELLLGENLQKHGHNKASIEVLTRTLTRLGQEVPRGILGWGWAVLSEVGTHVSHWLAPTRLRTRPSTPHSDLLLSALNRLQWAFVLHEPLKTGWAALAILNHAQRYLPSPAVAQGYAAAGAFLSAAGWFSYSQQLINRSLELRAKFQDPWGLANTHNWLGVSAFLQGQYEKAEAFFQQALRLYSQTGDRWEIHFNRYFWHRCNYQLGQPERSIKKLHQMAYETVQIGDQNSLQIILYMWAYMTEGDIPFEQLRPLCGQPRENLVAQTRLLLAEGYWHLFHERTEEALEVFEEAYRLGCEHFLAGSELIGLLPTLVMALRRRAEAVEGSDKPQSQRHRKRSFQLAKRSHWLAKPFPCHQPGVLRELAHAYASRGQIHKALKHVQKSYDMAQSQKARGEMIPSLLLIGQLRQRLGLPGAREQIETATQQQLAIDTAVRKANVWDEDSTKNPFPDFYQQRPVT